MLLKWKQSYVSDMYGFELWVRKMVRKKHFITMCARILMKKVHEAS